MKSYRRLNLQGLNVEMAPVCTPDFQSIGGGVPRYVCTAADLVGIYASACLVC